MKTTLIIDDALMRRLKAFAAMQGTTLSAVVGDFLRRGLQKATTPASAPRRKRELPSFNMGKPLVDVSDRAALDQAMDGALRDRR